MTLATRCSACGTSFRVVQDQLKVSGGWVRCGRCNEIFNALEGLYEIYTQPGDLPASSPRPDTVAAALSSPMPETFGRPPAAAPGSAGHTPATAPAATHPAAQRRAEPAASPPPPPAATHTPLQHAETSDAPRDVEVTLDSGQTIQMDDDDFETRVEVRAGTPGPTPSFMQQAARAKARRPRPVGFAWVFAALLLAGLAAGQMALAYRDLIGTRWPTTQPPLALACAWLGCKVQAPRRMAALSVDGSNLRQRGNETSYDLNVNVRNRSEWVVLMPAFELTLTDSQGQTLIRRVLSGRELGATGDTLAPGAELPLHAGLDINDRRVAGYTVEIFYP